MQSEFTDSEMHRVDFEWKSYDFEWKNYSCTKTTRCCGHRLACVCVCMYVCVVRACVHVCVCVDSTKVFSVSYLMDTTLVDIKHI